MVSNAAAPLSEMISLKVPFGVPSALAPLSPMIRIDQRVVELAEVLQSIEYPSDLMVGVLHEAGVDLHLSAEHRLEVLGDVIPGHDLGRASRELRVLGNNTQFLLACQRFLTQDIPTGVELALVLIAPLLGHVVGSVGGPGRVVHEERLARHQCLLLAHPGKSMVGQVLGEVVALFRSFRRFHRSGPLIERGVPLIRSQRRQIRRSTQTRSLWATGRMGPWGWSPRRGPRDTCRTGRCCTR